MFPWTPDLEASIEKLGYVGETSRSLQERFSEHLGYVKNKHLNKVTGERFNLKGHNHSDMKIAIMEKSTQQQWSV